MQNEFDFEQHTKNEKKQRPQKVLIGILCLCLGLAIGVGSTAVYFYNQVEQKLDTAAQEQSDLQMAFDDLAGEISSLDLEVEQLSYTNN